MKKTTIQATKARKNLDPRLTKVREVSQLLARPNKGWIRAIRLALGMNGRQLANRMGITQASLSSLEASEVGGSIRLASLQRAAEAMNCTLIYALMPNSSLEDIVENQALKVATVHLRPVEHTMLLENQSLNEPERRTFLKSYIRNELDYASLWGKDG